MAAFAADDGTKLAYHVSGDGRPVVCLPGGPMQDSAYFGELGGLATYRQLIRLDLRGTGQSATPPDTTSYRCDRLVDDVEALRRHLNLDHMDLLAHSGGTNLAVLYAQRHPERVNRLALITPSPFVLGVAVTAEDRLNAAQIRRNEPWFSEAFAALEAILDGRATAEHWQAMAPFAYGRWDEAARAHHAAEHGQMNHEAAAVYGADDAFDPPATRAALTAFESPVLVLAGEGDLNSPPRAMAEYAGLFPNSEFVVQPGAGHFPWLHDADRFRSVVAEFLG